MFTSPGSIAIETPHFTIYWYGIVLAIAFVVGLISATKIAKKMYNDPKAADVVCDSSIWTLFAGIIGARLYFVLLSFSYYSKNLDEIFYLQQGGLSIHGAIIGGLIGGGLFCVVKKIDFLKYADVYALGLPIAQAIGRWGNFFNSEAFGSPTNLPWAIFIPKNNRPLGYSEFEYFHPTFLYESLWNIFIFLVLYFVLRKVFSDKKGALFFSYLILYSIGRILIEFIRIDSVLNIMGIPIAVWVCVLTIIISIVFLIKILNQKKCL